MNYTVKTLDGDVDVDADPVEIPLPDGRILDAFVHRNVGLTNDYGVSAGGLGIAGGPTPRKAVANATRLLWRRFNADRDKFEAALAYAGVAPREAGRG